MDWRVLPGLDWTESETIQEKLNPGKMPPSAHIIKH